jgi:hypothetical protein
LAVGEFIISGEGDLSDFHSDGCDLLNAGGSYFNSNGRLMTKAANVEGTGGGGGGGVVAGEYTVPCSDGRTLWRTLWVVNILAEARDLVCW